MGQDVQEVKVPGDILIASLVPDPLPVISMGHSTSVALTSVSANTPNHLAAMIVMMVVHDDKEYRKSSWETRQGEAERSTNIPTNYPTP